MCIFPTGVLLFPLNQDSRTPLKWHSFFTAYRRLRAFSHGGTVKRFPPKRFRENKFCLRWKCKNSSSLSRKRIKRNDTFFFFLWHWKPETLSNYELSVESYSCWKVYTKWFLFLFVELVSDLLCYSLGTIFHGPGFIMGTTCSYFTRKLEEILWMFRS